MPTTAMHSLCTFLPWPFHCSCCLHMHFNCASNAHALEIHKVKYIFYCSASVSSKSLLPYWCISLPYWKYSTKTDATFVYIYLHLTVLHRLKLIIQVLGLWNIWCFSWSEAYSELFCLSQVYASEIRRDTEGGSVPYLLRWEYPFSFFSFLAWLKHSY